jgi:polar amino acid transport system substrate-binding protein
VPVEGEKRLVLLPELKQAGRVVRHMRERFDGRGYPDGLSGQQIPLESRILAVVDAYQAMTTERPFRPLRSHDETLSEIKSAAGTQFDPEVVEVFLELSGRMPGAANRRN